MTKPASGPAAVELREGLPIDEVHARLAFCNQLREVGHRGLAFYLADMQGRGLHQVTGHASAAHYAEGRLDISRRLAYDLVAVGGALRDLPQLDVAFAQGIVSWSKVVLVTRVATPEHEEAWIRRARDATYRELQLAVRLAKRGSAPRAPGDTKGLPEIRFDVRARVDALTHRKLELAREKLSAERGEPIDDATLLAVVAELILGSDDDGALPGRQRVDGSLYRIVLHGGFDDDAMELDTPDGKLPLGDTADCLLCDGECSVADQEAGDDTIVARTRDVATPPALRRRVLARDGHCCRSCGSKRGLMVHHIHFRSRGGRTRSRNLISLCSRCHALVHEDLLVLVGDHAGRIVFHDAEGRPLDQAGPRALAGASAAIRIERAPAPAAPPAANGAWEGSADGTSVPVRTRLPFAAAFDGILGQDRRLERFRRLARGVRARGRAFPHTLFCGPAGTGKTTLARALAAHVGAPLIEVSGPMLPDLAAVEATLARLPAGGMVFVDEIHAVPRTALERLYVVMDAARAADASQAVTVLAATTELAGLPAALRSRFGLIEVLGFHDEAGLAAIATAHAAGAGMALTQDAARRVAGCARGTPREVLRLTDRLLELFPRPAREGAAPVPVTGAEAEQALATLGFDTAGLAPLEQHYLAALRAHPGPVSLSRLAGMLGVAARTLKACVEPYLAWRGLVQITRHGRALVPLRPARVGGA